MAGEWIKLEKATPQKPEIWQLSAILKVPTDQVLGLCMRFWAWCDDHLKEGTVPGSSAILDGIIGHPGFAAAMIAVGWLREDGRRLKIPNSERHMANTAKTRMSDAERAKAYRQRRAGVAQTVTGERDDFARQESERVTDAVTPCDAPCDDPENGHERKPLNGTDSASGRHEIVTQRHVTDRDAVTDASRGEEKRREEKRRIRAEGKPKDIFDPMKVIPPIFQSAEFVVAWGKWILHRREIRKPLTPTAARQQMEKLVKCDVPRAIAAIEHSISSGWQGIFEDKAKQPSTNLFGSLQRFADKNGMENDHDETRVFDFDGDIDGAGWSRNA